MKTATSPKILNLDDLETPEADVTVVHKGVSHGMRVLTVERFISQQKRAAEHQRLAEQKVAAGDNVTDTDVADVVTLIRDSILEFFPTLPVDELPTQKMFMIFGWLNEMSAEVNKVSSADVAEEVEGNAPEVEGQTES